MSDVVYIDFVIQPSTIDDFDLDHIDACCKISAEIGASGLIYGTDFWFHEFSYDKGDQILKFGFQDKHEAMILKLAGIGIARKLH